ncbi:MAG: RloB family protein [Anaeroplasma bactoclasticum]|nr:RloB family protein [Anaeroplasma bactoclasticum]
MSKGSRNGQRQSRSERTNRRKPELGYYLIVTDTEGTERIYFNGLRDSIKPITGDKLIIKVLQTKNRNLIKEAKEFLSELPQYAEPWIVFDRDKVKNFDSIIENAMNSNISVAWSNPCIEIWFHAYFGKMPNYQNSTICCREFANEFQKKLGQEYDKTDERLYLKLLSKGNEEEAIKIAERKLKEHFENGENKPSKMLSATTVHKLINEIKSKL